MIKRKLKGIISWSLSSWLGSIVAAACLAGLLLTGNFILQAKDAGRHPSNYVHPAQIINSLGFAQQWKLLMPKELGISEWQVGQYAKYTLSDSKGTIYNPEFQVVAKLERDDKITQAHQLNPTGAYWMRSSGFSAFRDHPRSDFQVVSTADMRLKEKKLSFGILDGYIPIEDGLLERYPLVDQALLTRLGREKISTAAGDFVCDLYHADIGGVLLKIWVNPIVPPLGIVRMSSEKEHLELVSHGIQTEEMRVPGIFQPVLDGRSTMAHGCESCHASDQDLHTPVYPPR